MPRSVTSATEPKWLTVWRVHVRAKHMPNRHGRNSAHRAFDRSKASGRARRDSRLGFTGHLLLPGFKDGHSLSTWTGVERGVLVGPATTGEHEMVAAERRPA